MPLTRRILLVASLLCSIFFLYVYYHSLSSGDVFAYAGPHRALSIQLAPGAVMIRTDPTHDRLGFFHYQKGTDSQYIILQNFADPAFGFSIANHPHSAGVSFSPLLPAFLSALPFLFWCRKKLRPIWRNWAAEERNLARETPLPTQPPRK